MTEAARLAAIERRLDTLEALARAMLALDGTQTTVMVAFCQLLGELPTLSRSAAL